MSAATAEIDLLGTDEPIAERRVLRAGRLSAAFEDGALRNVRVDGVEVIRAVSYLGRDNSWGTYRSRLTDLAIVETDDAFEVTYRGRMGATDAGFAYRIRILGEASGALLVEAEGEALGDFLTNRTGFVVLHPPGLAGRPLLIRHTDGAVEETTFPSRIMADQPAFDIAAMTFSPAAGLSCTLTLEGEAFEMEDQRNWADASFKTYVRPLSKPRPYVIATGTSDRQCVAMAIEGQAATDGPREADIVAVGYGAADGAMPGVGLFVAGEEDFRVTAPLPGLMQHLIIRIDARCAWPDRTALDALASFAAASGAALAFELVFDAHEPDAEAAAALSRLADAGVEAETLLVVPRREFRTRPSGVLPDGEHGTEDLVAALRRAGFRGSVGAGTPSYFAEFNRNPPRGADFVFFSVAAIVHAADDLSVMETLEVYPDLLASAEALCPDVPIWLGPCTIGVRHNPYGADVQPNPDGRRVPSARQDPRQGSLFGAAFAAAAAAEAARCGAAVIVSGAPSGSFGVRDDAGPPRPVLAVVHALAAAAGAGRVRLCLGRGDLSGVGYRLADGIGALLVNRSSGFLAVEMPRPLRSARIVGPDAAWRPLPAEGARMVLPPYATVLTETE